MIRWNFEELEMKGAYLVTPFFADDVRGGFLKDYSREEFAKNGIDYELAEVFYTISHKGVVRAMHFQRVMQQPKLVRCVHGKVYDVIIDLRKDSPTFKKWQGFFLSGDNMKELLIPAGFGHGYLVLEESIVSYKCAEKFYGEYDGGIKYDDPDMGIEWPFDLIGGKDRVILADKDKQLPSFREFMDNHSAFWED
jgi:dTDP-4-dehydrorhamnose 3,5-epimerase